jgi:hypothetical protein
MGLPEDRDNDIAPASGTESRSMEEATAKHELTQDEYQLAKLGYKQEFFRSLGLFENW